MDRRIQQALDGDLERKALPPSLEREMAASEHLFARITDSIPGEPLPDLAPAVLARVGASRKRQRIRSPLAWVLAPRTFTLRPAYVLAAAAVMMVAVIHGRRPAEESPAPAVAAAAAQVFVEFRFDAPDARQVMLAGDFTAWRPAHTLARSSEGVWTVVVPLSPGVHEYAFVVDGERWVPDPNAAPVSDGFGGTNSRLSVLTPDVPRRS